MYDLADLYRAWRDAISRVGSSRYGHDNRAWQRRADAYGQELVNAVARP